MYSTVLLVRIFLLLFCSRESFCFFSVLANLFASLFVLHVATSLWRGGKYGYVCLPCSQEENNAVEREKIHSFVPQDIC